MQNDKASFTAESVAAIRAVESAKPEAERLCYDPYARYFISGGRDEAGMEFWRNLLFSVNRDNFGVFNEIVLRTRYIDDYIMNRTDGELRQIVILGAGYDSRAYRLDGLKDKVRVFEVDHPSTQKLKIEKLKEIPGILLDRVIYVPVDFQSEKLDRKLSESGYDNKLNSIFILEGVTMYLTAEAVDETLAFITKNSGSGTSVIFNYLVEPVGEGPNDPEMSWWTLKRRNEWLEHYDLIGEPFRFGIREGEVDGFLTKRGFCQVMNVSCKDMRNAFATGANTKRSLTPWLATAHAIVKPRE